MYVDMYFLLNFRLKFVGQRRFNWRRFGSLNYTLELWGRTGGLWWWTYEEVFGGQKVFGPMMEILVIRILFFRFSIAL
jgi:hypothetical protein